MRELRAKDDAAAAFLETMATEGAAVVMTSVTVASARRSSVAASSTLTVWNAMAAAAPVSAPKQTPNA